MTGGDFEPGDQLPSERELIEKLNVSRNVLREAFHVLESRGVIVSHQGKGRFFERKPNFRERETV
ncbi:MAG: winged helix-turn-helix domain-containing protein [Anaerobutyricum hallii]